METNTLYHVRPGARALTLGMFGCDLRCPYCQNWRVSQALRERLVENLPIDVTPAALVEAAAAAGASVVCAAYNEPMITAEWAHAVFAEASARSLVTAPDIGRQHDPRGALVHAGRDRRLPDRFERI